METPASSVNVKIAAASDQEAVISVLVMAFGADPPSRWVFPDAQAYITHFPNFVRAFAGRAFDNNSAYFIDGYGGAALWLPPGVHPDEEALVNLINATAPEEIREDLFGVFEQMGGFHPSEPHWYLPLIGVDVHLQSRGYGSALLRRVTSICDRDRLPAYLESTNPRNTPLYERHGFKRLATIQVGSSPPIVPMLRQPSEGR